MQVSTRRSYITSWLVGAVVSASTPFAFADGLLESDANWDSPVQPVALRRERPCPPCPCPPSQPEVTTTEKGAPQTKPEETSKDELIPQNEEPLNQPNFAGPSASSGTMASSGTIPGYLDYARICSRVRVRYDNSAGMDEPTRAEFFYPTLAAFGGPGPVGGGQGAGQSGNVDMRELSTYVEAAWGPCFSVFGEFPIRWVDNVDFAASNVFPSGTQAGAGDVKAGIRYGLYASCDEWLTAQVRAWTPTGDARQALGVGHPSIDVALLYEKRTNSRTSWWGEIDDWQSIDAGTAFDVNNPVTNRIDLEANVLEYGIGVGYDLWQSCDCRPQSLTAVFEVVGWTVLEGAITPQRDTGGPVIFEDASGDTIVNGKYGLRYNWTCCCHEESVYVGYGNNWTDERWYSSIFRLEYTHLF